MSQQFPQTSNNGDINIGATIKGHVVVIGHGNQVRVVMQGSQDRIMQLDPPHLQSLIHALADGSAQVQALTASGLSPSLVTPALRAEDLQGTSPFASPLGIPAPIIGDTTQMVRNFAALDGYLSQLDQQFGVTITGVSNGQQNLNLGDLLLQKGNLALWRFREGALRLFAEQAGLFALADPQSATQPALQAFQTAARNNLEIQRSWVLFLKYCTQQPVLIDQQAFIALSQGHWQVVLERWETENRLTREQSQAERLYLSAIGQYYNAEEVQKAVREAEWYFSESLRRQPTGTAMVNLAALLAESALLNYIETGADNRSRLEQARNLFQQAHTLLMQRPDREGKIALAQCIVYQAISLPPNARLDMVPWASAQARQLYTRVGQQAPATLRWDMMQRNLARRDPSFIDWQKLQQARELLVNAGAVASLVSLTEQLLGARLPLAQAAATGIGSHAASAQLAHPGESAASSAHASAGGQRVAHGLHQVPAHGAASHVSAVATHAASHGVAHGLRHLLSTVAGKVVAVAVITAVVGASVTGVVLTTRGVTPTQRAGIITEFPISPAGGGPWGITVGPDGNLWFAEINPGRIGRITPSGTVTEFPVPPTALGSGVPQGITAGPDGNLWFTEINARQIGRITPSGTVTEFPFPTGGGAPQGITAGPDGNLWFTESNTSQIGRITPSGTITEFPLSADAGPQGITAGPDGNLWFTETNARQIGRITPSGTVTEFPTPFSAGNPTGITRGPDGNLWFTELTGHIGRITPSGTITEFPIPTAVTGPQGITAGPDGNLWFTESNAKKIGRITPSGTVTEFLIPTASSGSSYITAGPDGAIWFTEYNDNKIGRITS